MISSIFLIISLSPVLLITGILVKINLGSPVIFEQERPGKDQKVFKMYKFRSMKNAYDKDGEPLSDKERLTPFGMLIRKLSLDELPELFNIFKGDMSFVGPRPLLVSYLPLYNNEQQKRHLVRPGLTGLAQVNGRNSLSWEEKFKYDVEYVRDLCFVTDMKILLKTFLVVLKRKDINSTSDSPVEPFTGAAK